MKKRNRIFISIHYLELGGAERALLGLLNALDKEKCDVDLFVYSHQGELMKSIPQGVRLLDEIPAYTALERPIKDIVREGHWRIAWGRLKAKWLFRRYMKRSGGTEGSGIFQYVADCTTKYLPSLYKYGEYDLAISFLTPHNIVRDKVLAKRKMAWIHTDYATISVDERKELPVWDSYDSIAAVSEGVKASFVQRFPALENKVCVVENILSPRLIRMQATQGDASTEMPRIEGEYIFCSVGRFCTAKNFDNVPFICQALVRRGLRFKWYIIGYGGDEPLIRSNIVKAGMENVCVLLGKKQNPYPYMAACDVYLQPSRYEGKAVTVREAQILEKPVIITRFPTSASQLTDGVDGVIVPNDIEGAAKGIVDFIEDTDKQERIKKYLHIHSYGNEGEVEKIYKELGIS